MPHLLDQEILAINPMIPQPFRIRRRLQENADTFTLEIESIVMANPFAFSPGQFNMLYVFGVGEVPISICGYSAGQTIAHTTRAVGTVTRAMAKLKRGELLGVRGPVGSAWPTEAALERDVVLIAGESAWRRCGRFCIAFWFVAARRPVLSCSAARAHRRICSTLASWNAGEKSAKCT